MPLISIVVPCYNEQESLPIFLKELDGVVRIMTQQDPGISFEAVLIDDGSADKTLAVMKAEAAAAHPYAIRWHSFSRNFGKEAALLAGLQHAKGGYVATMDADMQDPPSLLPQMYEILQTEDYDNVANAQDHPRRRASHQVVLCPYVLQEHQPHFQGRHRRRSTRF